MNVQQLETIINSSKVFSINKEKDESLYLQERNRLAEALLKYFIEKSKTGEFKYSLELIETLEDCISSYKEDKGEFLHYFNKSFSRRIKTTKGKDKKEDLYHGISGFISRKQVSLVKNYVKYMASKGVQIGDLEQTKKFAQIANVEIIDIEEAVVLYYSNPTKEMRRIDKEGNEEDEIDNIPSYDNQFKTLIESTDIFERISKAYDNLQNRDELKAMIAMWLTIKIMFIMDVEEIEHYLKDMSFFSKIVYMQYRDKEEPTNKELADLFKRSPESFSRTISTFLSKIK